MRSSTPSAPGRSRGWSTTTRSRRPRSWRPPASRPRPLVVHLALEQGEDGALGILERGDVALLHLHPVKLLATGFGGLVGARVTALGREVREPGGRHPALRLHDAAVRAVADLDDDVARAALGVHLLALPAEEARVELERGVDV